MCPRGSRALGIEVLELLLGAGTYWQQERYVIPKRRFFGFWVNNVVHKSSRGNKKKRGDGEPILSNLNGIFKGCFLSDYFYIFFKSSRFRSHFLLHQCIVDITILQHYSCFLYFFMSGNCFCTFV